MASDDHLLDFSDGFVLSSGTIPIDISRGLVLLLYRRSKGEYFLPKGRKDVGESLESAAIRETKEETGFAGRLFEHEFPTKATGLTSSRHTEPIAVQQRFNNGVRKIIFWYVAEVDSMAPSKQALEEGEDFAVWWVSKEAAAAIASFPEDKHIIKTAVNNLRQAYLNPAINPTDLGFLSISLGGSSVYEQRTAARLEDGDQDWDGFGIVKLRKDISKLINDHFDQLCALLRLHKAETPDLKLDGDLYANWDVLRFSGWTEQGSNQTIKIWSEQSICHVSSKLTASQLRVLSHKVSRFTQHYYPEIGSQLSIHQPSKVTDDMYILQDNDFQAPPVHATTLLASNNRPYEAIYPGVTCDLFLSSLCLYQERPGIISRLKAILLHKWQKLSGASNMQAILPLFYRVAKMDQSYRRRLFTEIEDLGRFYKDYKGTTQVCERSVNSELTSEKSVLSSDIPTHWQCSGQGTNLTISIAPLMKIPNSPCRSRPPLLTEAYPLVRRVSEDSIVIGSTPFSKSTGIFAHILASSSTEWKKVFVKTGDSVLQELKAYPLVLLHFPTECLQQIEAVDLATNAIYFQRLDGTTSHALRLKYLKGSQFTNAEATGQDIESGKQLISLELRRAEDVLAAYRSTFGFRSSLHENPQQRITTLYYHRLAGNTRFYQLYGKGVASFLKNSAGQIQSLDKFLDHPLVINGRQYSSLGQHLARATQVLDPKRAGGMIILPQAFGLGDGDGGNVMVSTASSPPSIRYIDYETAGYHTPFVDMAKPIYLDGFYNVAYADVINEDASKGNESTRAHVTWKQNGECIHIDYSLNLKPLDKALAVIKLEYVLRPVLSMLGQNAPELRKLAEETLAYSLFACALLTRDYSKRADAFYLNLALGVQLATNMKATLLDCFGWDLSTLK